MTTAYWAQFRDEIEDMFGIDNMEELEQYFKEDDEKSDQEEEEDEDTYSHFRQSEDLGMRNSDFF